MKYLLLVLAGVFGYLTYLTFDTSPCLASPGLSLVSLSFIYLFAIAEEVEESARIKIE